MAVAEVIKGGGEATRETVKVSAETWDIVAKRAKIVMIRQLPTYDYERVFWNSTFTVGLVGLGWAAVKLGIIMRWFSNAMKDIGEWLTDPQGKMNKEYFYYIYDWVEGIHKDEPIEIDTSPWAAWIVFAPLSPGLTMEQTKKVAAKHFRDNPEKWAEIKTKFINQYGEGAMPKGSEEHRFEPSDILDAANRFFDSYGSLVPIAAVMGHMGLEFVRVKGLQRRIKKEADLE